MFLFFLLIFAPPLIFADQPSHHPVLDILNGPHYSKDIRPLPITPNNPTESNSTGNATVIKVNISVKKIDRIDELKMEFAAQLVFRQMWQDQRLMYNGSPDLFFTNEGASSIHNTFKLNTFKRVYPNGQVIWSSRITVTFGCQMDLTYFPFDSQICSMEISEYSETIGHILLVWDGDDPVELVESRNSRLSQFTLTDIKTSGRSSGRLGVWRMGDFSKISADFYLRRHSTVYMLLIYLPSTLIVTLTWISFWLGPSISARLSLTLTLLLTMTAQIQGANQNLPKVSYVKAVDVWTGFCTTIAVLAIMETATVAFLLQRNKIFFTPVGDEEDNLKDDKQERISRYNSFARKMDKLCSILFPFTFATFTMCYVFVYVV
ncbi:glutamate-gated chloride channel [Folsomia candida]|uniref:glutamate-gated chloride channel n=1 Tax=Folsomia candida TaxID=158441 RepID=UPI000B8F2040|nr:glutamate-gated chloride channel [Folsomia candida]